MIFILIIVAVVYTTPWDNYLVATEIWWYDPDLVTGITIGWVPIEEYTFFITQTILIGLFWVLLVQLISIPEMGEFVVRKKLNYAMSAIIACCWILSFSLLLLNWKKGTYLNLILVWALIPIFIQIVYGADILWHYRKIVTILILIPSLYLSAADAYAIDHGIWIIGKETTTGILIGGILPIEEMIFFFVTNILIVFGMTLGLAQESHERIQGLLKILGNF